MKPGELPILYRRFFRAVTALSRLAGLALLWAVTSDVTPGRAAADVTTAIAPMRVAFSSNLFADVNEDDARASVMAWAQTLGREHGIPVDPATKIIAGTDAIVQALRDSSIDVVTMTTNEYWVVRREVPLGPFILGVVNGRTTEEYVLLVHRDSGITQLGELRKRSLVIYQNPRAGLSPVWLETLLLQSGLGRSTEFFSRTTETNKLTRVVLPVFFRQADACLLTRAGFQTMNELNPQVGQQLKVLAASAALVPIVFCFRGNYNSPDRDKLLDSIDRISETPAGRQTLMLFQSERLVKSPATALDSACELMDLHRRLLAAAAGARPDDSTVAPRTAIPGRN